MATGERDDRRSIRALLVEKQALKLSEEHYRRVIETARDAYIACDASGVIRTCNPAVTETFGWERADLVGKKAVETIIAPARRPGFEQAIDLYLRTGDSYLSGPQQEVLILKSSGDVVPVEITPWATTSEGETTFHVFLRDISERKAAEAELRQTVEALRKSEERYRSAVETMQDAYIAYDLEGTVISANGSATAMFGWTQGELVGASLADTVIHPTERDGFARSLVVHATQNSASEPLRMEVVARHADGHDVPIELVAWATTEADNVTVHSFSRDISERKRSEADLRDAMDALRETDLQRRRLLIHLVDLAERERAEIASNIHDDSVQTMTAALLRLEMLRADLEDPAQQTVADKAIETVRMSIDRLRHLLFELRPPALDSCGLAAAVGEHLDHLRREADTESDTEFVLESDLKQEPPVAARVILYRITQEALANVRKHAEAAHVKISITERDRGTVVLIRDDGIGFAFDPTEDAGPTHYGVRSMSERAQQAGGWCNVKAAPDGGTTVEAWVPDMIVDAA